MSPHPTAVAPGSATAADRTAGAPAWPAAEEPRTDAHLMRGLAAGDETCLAALHRRWSPLVYALAWRTLGDAAEAEDVAQQVFLGVWRGCAGYRPERGPVAGWIVGITRRKIADALSARTRRGELVAAAGAALPAEESATGRPEAAVDRVLVRQALAGAPRGPAARAAPGLLRGPHPDPDRGAHRVAAGHGEEPCAPGPAPAARRPRSSPLHIKSE